MTEHHTFVYPDLDKQVAEFKARLETITVQHAQRLSNLNAAVEELIARDEKSKARTTILENKLKALQEELALQRDPQKGSARIPWTPEEDEIVRKTIGKPVSERQKQLPRRSRNAITQRTHHLGLSSRIELKPWTEKEEKRLLQMRTAGFSWNRILLELDRTQKACEQHLVLMRKRAEEKRCEQKDGNRHSPGDAGAQHGTNGQAS
jgi:hypothetical protein